MIIAQAGQIGILLDSEAVDEERRIMGFKFVAELEVTTEGKIPTQVELYEAVGLFYMGVIGALRGCDRWHCEAYPIERIPTINFGGRGFASKATSDEIH